MKTKINFPGKNTLPNGATLYTLENGKVWSVETNQQRLYYILDTMADEEDYEDENTIIVSELPFWDTFLK